MTVGELKEQLEGFDEKTEVVFSYPSGDYWNTTVAKDIDDVEEGSVTYSAYHNTYKVLNDDDLYDEDGEEIIDEDYKKVVIIF